MGNMYIALRGFFACILLVIVCGICKPDAHGITPRCSSGEGGDKVGLPAGKLISDGKINQQAGHFRSLHKSHVQNTGTLQMTITPQMNGGPLILNDRLYRTPNGDSLYVDVLRFYLTSVQLVGNAKARRFVEKDSYHLFDAEATGTHTIALNNVPAGRYDSLCFYVGTDSLTNVSGAMGGDLDPTKGMYWAWNSGYINIKLEGRSLACKTRRHAFEFHIGGYMPPHQSVRRIILPIQNLTIRENQTATLRIIVDLARFFKQIQLAETNSVMIPSGQATQLADYFTTVFRLE